MNKIILLLLFSLLSVLLPSAIARASETNEPPAECIVISEDEPISDEVEISTAAVTSKDPAAVRQAVKQAEFLLREAEMNYEQGNKTRAEKLFHESFETLNSAELEVSSLYAVRSSYNNLITAVTKTFSDKKQSKTSSGKYRIPMDTDNELVKKYIALYSQGRPKETITRAFERSGRYRSMILKVLKEYDLPEELIYLPVVESLYSNNDLSRAGALGLWQIMPERGRALNLRVNHWIDERKDPEKATRAAAQYLKELYTLFDDWHLALAAYNRGEFGLSRDLKFLKATNIETMNSRNAVPRETRNYVPQFIACVVIGDNYKDYGFEFNFENPVEYDDVVIDKIVDLEVIAKCAGTDTQTIRDLNPSLRAWCTPYNYPDFKLHIPRGAKAAFLDNLAQVKDLNPSRGYIKYKISRGDYLGKIAKKFQTSVSALKQDNKIKNEKALRIGQVLIIRPGRKYSEKSGG